MDVETSDVPSTDLATDKSRVKFEINVLNKAEGSAILSIGKNVVLAALYGPHELKHLKIQDDVAFQVTYRTKAWTHNGELSRIPIGQALIGQELKYSYWSKKDPCSQYIIGLGNSFKVIEDLIRSACESVFFPRPFSRHESMLLVQELQDDSSILSCAVNAGCLAMMASGMEMKHMVTASSCCCDKNGKIILNPSGDEIKDSKYMMTAAFECVNYSSVMVNFEGTGSAEEFNSALELCKSGAKEMLQLIEASIKKYCTVL